MSIMCEEGMSQVRIVQSIDAVINHLASGLKQASISRPSCP